MTRFVSAKNRVADPPLKCQLIGTLLYPYIPHPPLTI
jgi:hypothetical protein